DYFDSANAGFFEYSTDAGNSWTTVTGAIPLSEGDTDLLVRTDTIDDSLDEGDELFSLKATLNSAGVAYDATGTATIIDNDVPTVEINPGAASNNIDVDEGKDAVFSVSVKDTAVNSTLTLTLADGTAVDADYFDSANAGFFEYSTDAGNSWTTVTGAIPLSEGDTDLLVRTDTIDDSLDEGDELFSLKATLNSAGVAYDATGTATIIDNDDNPHNLVAAVGNIAVSEEGLDFGLKDGTPIGDDTTNQKTYEGFFTFEDVFNNGAGDFSIALAGLTNNSDSSGLKVDSWVWDAGTATLTGSTSAKDVMTIKVGPVQDAVDAGSYKAAYTVTLLETFDHPDNNVEDVLSLEFKFSVMEVGGATIDKIFSVNIEDDMPVAINTTQQFAGPTVDTNLMVILDLSGSMNSRLALAKEAINNLIDSYDDLGDIKVHVVTFSDTAETNPGGLWLSATAAKNYIDALSTGGGTNYDAALAVAMEAFDVGNNSISGAQNISYFLSDGKPNRSDGNTDELENNDGGGNSDDGIQIAEEAIWIDFLKLNNINSFALGIGSGITADELNPIAYNALNNIDDNTPAILVSNINELDGALNNTVVPFVTGNIFSDPNNNIETGFGADGGYVFNVTLDVLVSGVSTSVTFTYDIAGDNITNDSGVLGDILGSAILKVATEEGEFVLDMQSGEYQYQLAAFNGHVDDLISYRLIDNDLDHADGAMTLIIGKPIGIEGANIDVDTYVYKNGSVDKNVHTHAYDEETGYNNVVDAFDYIGKSDKNGESKHAEIDDVISSDYFMLIVLNGHRNAGSNILIDTKSHGVQATDAYLYGSDGPSGVKGFDNQVYTLVDGNDIDGVRLLEGLQISFDANAILIPDVNGNFPIPDNNGDYLDSELSYGIRMTETGNVKNGLHGTESPADEHRDGALTIMAVKVIKDANGDFIDPTIDYGGLPSPQSPSVDPYIIGLDEDQLLWETTVFAHTSGDDPRSDQEYIDNEALLTAINTGMFVDGIVEGLAYSTSSGFSGFTDASGGFKYTDGDLISFSIGSVVIGTVSSAAMADGTLFLQEIAGVGLEDMNNDYVENMAVLLQSLDNDADAYNGIVIEQSVHQAFSDDSFDMETISKADLQALLVDNGYQPVDEDAAMQHVRDMIELNTGMTEFDARISVNSLSPVEEHNSVLTGTSGDDILFTGLGEDSMTGAAGADRFSFSRDDIGDSVETDTILDFNSAEGDKIDLADLLIGEHLDNLDQYLSFEKSGADTLIHVKSDADGAVDHIIKLSNIDLFTKVGGGSYSQSEILDNLKGDLIIDH
ncbi:MAG: type I secretion C-terminal target domain-containing protein, partial [Pseudomonadales bacterium]|nr:type I secretion C-terminal target domain-containing protein [Pseudomonadales bacterium]